MGIVGPPAPSLLGGVLGGNSQNSLSGVAQGPSTYYNQAAQLRQYTSGAEVPVDPKPMLLNINIQIEEIENGYLFTLGLKKMYLTDLDGIGDIILSRIAADRILQK